jgi:cytochrome c556
MKTFTLAFSLVLLPAFTAPALRAQDAPPPGPDGPPAWQHSWRDEPKTPLAKDMHKIASAVRKLSRQIGDPDSNPASLDLVATIRAAAVAASGETPAFASDQPEATRAKFVADFQSAMKEFVGKVDTLAADLKANDNDAAAKDLKALVAAERAGHKEFRKPRPKPPQPPPQQQQ